MVSRLLAINKVESAVPYLYLNFLCLATQIRLRSVTNILIMALRAAAMLRVVQIAQKMLFLLLAGLKLALVCR